MNKRIFTGWVLALCMCLNLMPSAIAVQGDYPDLHTIFLSSNLGEDGRYSHLAIIDGVEVEQFDYVWHADPATAHDDVKNAPAEFYTGTKPETDAAAYVARDIFYFPKLEESAFTAVNYDNDNEWAFYYTVDEYKDFIFATLPMRRGGIPSQMMHTPEEAYENAVLHITKAGTYQLSGSWHGQIWVDLGDSDDTFTDENAKVTLILNSVDITCTVAPAVVFYSVYECDNAWEGRDTHTASVGAGENAGANIVVADGTVNNLVGTNVYRMLKTQYKSDKSEDTQTNGTVRVQKKHRKIDGALYSFESLRVRGETAGTGVLNITAGFEGLDSELHLFLNGGNINIFSQDDGVNVNEDGVSVLTLNGGNVHILAGLGEEGDGIDSNGYLVVNGGNLVTMASPMADSGMDSDRGTYVNGGTVVALGSTMDWAESENGHKVSGGQAAMNLQFAASQSADEAIIITDTNGKIVFAYDPDKDEVAGNNARWYQGAIISSPNLHIGESYFVYVGGDVIGTETAGIYDVTNPVSKTDASKQQCYSKTGSFTRPAPPPGPPPGPPPAFDTNNPQGMNGIPVGGNPGGPQGMNGVPAGGGPGGPQGMNGAPANGGPGGPQGMNGPGPGGGNPPPPGAFNILPNSNGKTTFVMNEAVNGFQAVTDYSPVSFEDIVEGNYYYDAVQWAAGTKIAKGITPAKFEPNGDCTRGQTVLYMWRAAGSPQNGGGNPMGPPPDGVPQPQPPMQSVEPVTNPFKDVKESDEYYQAVLWALQNGITTGVTETLFEPDSIVTRAQSLTFLYRWTKPTAPEGKNPFSDVSSDSYYYDAILWAAENKVTAGTTATTFTPAATLTKANFLTFLYRYVEAELMPMGPGGPPPMIPQGKP